MYVCMYVCNNVQKYIIKARRALATLVAQLFSVRMENTALNESARTGNFSVAATKKLLPVAA